VTPPESVKSSDPDFLLDIAINTFNTHWNALDILDQKASNLLAMVGVMITLLITLQPDCPNIRDWHSWPFLIGLGCILTSGLFALSVHRGRELSVPDTPKRMLDYFKAPGLVDPERQTKEAIISNLNNAIEENKPANDKKLLRLNWAHNFLIAGLFLIVLSYVFC
jgi:hypothetical protein